MDPSTFKKLQAASEEASSSSGSWEILSYTAYPKTTQEYTGYDNWTGYQNGAANSIFNGVNNTNVTTSWDTSRPWHRFGQIGYGPFHNHTKYNSGANNRTSAGDGDGWYEAAYDKTGLRKVALVGNEGTVDLNDPTNSTNHLVYDLVGTSGNTSDSDAGTGAYSVISLLQTLSAYNRNNANWTTEGGGPGFAHNQLFNGPNCRNFTSGGGSKGQAGYSGILTSSAGKMRPIGLNHHTISTTYYPDFFCFWGINLDSDHDTQVCAAYYGNGTNFDCIGRPNNMGSYATQSQYLKSDSWRGLAPIYTFWSMWGNDWHGNSKTQNISGSAIQVGNDYYSGTNITVYPNPPNGGTPINQAISMQSFPGTATPTQNNNLNVDPNLHMCKQVYFLGFS